MNIIQTGAQMPLLKQSNEANQPQLFEVSPASRAQRKPPTRAVDPDPLLTAEEVASRLHVSTDWVWDHSSRKKPYLPVIRMGDGTLRYRHSGIEAFIDERERLSAMRRRSG